MVGPGFTLDTKRHNSNQTPNADLAVRVRCLRGSHRPVPGAQFPGVHRAHNFVASKDLIFGNSLT